MDNIFSLTFLFILTFLWLCTFVVMCINLDVILKKEGSSSPLFGMTLFMVVLSFYCLAIYAADVIKYEEGIDVDYSGPVPFHLVMTILVSLFLVVTSSWSIAKYKKDYESDDSIPDWKKKIFLWGNVVLLMLACLELGLRRGTQLTNHLSGKYKSWQAKKEAEERSSSEPAGIEMTSSSSSGSK